jgi:hypothetical protein
MSDMSNFVQELAAERDRLRQEVAALKTKLSTSTVDAMAGAGALIAEYVHLRVVNAKDKADVAKVRADANTIVKTEIFNAAKLKINPSDCLKTWALFRLVPEFRGLSKNVVQALLPIVRIGWNDDRNELTADWSKYEKPSDADKDVKPSEKDTIGRWGSRIESLKKAILDRKAKGTLNYNTAVQERRAIERQVYKLPSGQDAQKGTVHA